MTARPIERSGAGYQHSWGRIQMAFALAVLALLAAAVAGQEPLWVDEQITVDRVTARSYWELLTVLPRRQPHLPTYYVFLKAAGFRVGHAVSLAAFPLTALATVELARSSGLSEARAWLAGYLVAVSPFLATQATWLRMYSPLTLLLTVGLWQTQDGQYRRAGIAFAAGLLVHPFAVLPAAWYIFQVYQQRRETVAGRYLVAAATPVAMLVAVKYVKGGPGFSGYATGVTHGVRPGLRELIVLPASTLAGTTLTSGMIVLAAVAVGAAVARPTDRYRSIYLYILVPIAGITAATYLLHPVFRPKYYGFIAPAVAVVLATPSRAAVDRYACWLSVLALYVSGWVFRTFGVIVTRYYRFL